MAPEAGPETKKAGKEHEVLEALEGLMLKLKLPYFGQLMRRADSFDVGKD